MTLHKPKKPNPKTYKMGNFKNSALYVCARFIRLQALWSRDHARQGAYSVLKYKLAIS